STYAPLTSTDPGGIANTVYVRQIDKAGNVSTSSSLTFTLDTVVNAPLASWVADPAVIPSTSTTGFGIFSGAPAGFVTTAAGRGLQVLNMGDINGDGIDDMLVSYVLVNNTSIISGMEAYVLFGKTDGYQLDGNGNLDLATLRPGEGFAVRHEYNLFLDPKLNPRISIIQGVGDINGDSYDDFVVGVQAVGPDGKMLPGTFSRMYLIYGHAGTDFGQLQQNSFNLEYNFVLDPTTLTPAQGFLIINQGSNNLQFINVGDVNGDGIDDFFISTIRNNGVSTTGGAEAYVVFGKPSGSTYTFDGNGSLNLSALRPEDGFIIRQSNLQGTKTISLIQSVGDVNGDGYDDFVVGVQALGPDGQALLETFEIMYLMYGHAAGTSFGQVVASPVFGGVFNDVLDLRDLSNPAIGFQIINQTTSNNFHITNMGDINGDGIDDLFISTTKNTASGVVGGTEAYVVFGKPEGSTYTLTNGTSGALDLTGLRPADGFIIRQSNLQGGQTISLVQSVGDTNGDGYADVVVGVQAVGADGKALPETFDSMYLLYGHAGTTFGQLQPNAVIGGVFNNVVNLANAADPSQGFAIVGPASTHLKIINMGDINGDGYDDFFISTTKNTATGVSPGTESYVVFGKPAGGYTLNANGALELQDLRPADGFIVRGRAYTGFDPYDFATMIQGVGDINGDGYDDFVIGSQMVTTDNVLTPDTFSAMYLVYGHAGTDFGVLTPSTRTGGVFNNVLDPSTLHGEPGGTSIPASYSLNGSAEPGATLQLTFDGNAASAVFIAADSSTGAWSYTPTLSNGDHSVSIVQTDKAGNVSDPTVLTINNAGPSILLSTPFQASAAVPTAAAVATGATLNGSSGDEWLSDGGYSNVTLNGGTGDDMFYVSSASTSINGGSGTDTLLITGNGLNLNLDNVTGIERVILGTSGASSNTLEVRLSDVLQGPDATPRQLLISGDGSDTVNLNVVDGFAHTAGDTQVFDGHIFDVWHATAGIDVATLLLQQDLLVQQIA
ncbi:MAG: Ig-like domain-containing protein, partial [Pseudomonadales bacterium]|nr:Ig-like domain-containing protein [Pseudomonadales bacterium]